MLAPRQWRGMRAWLGEPEQFQDPVFDSIAARTKAFGELSQLMAALFADKTMAELVAEGAGARRADRRGADPRRRHWNPSTSPRSERWSTPRSHPV